MSLIMRNEINSPVQGDIIDKSRSSSQKLTLDFLTGQNQNTSLTCFLENNGYSQLARTQRPYYVPSIAAQKNTGFDLLEMRAAIGILDSDLAYLPLTKKISLLVYAAWSPIEAERIDHPKRFGQNTSSEQKVAQLFDAPEETIAKLLKIGDEPTTPTNEFFDMLDLARKMRTTKRNHGLLEANAGLLKYVKDVIINPETDKMTWDQIATLIPQRYVQDAPNTSAKGDRIRLAVTDLIRLREINSEKAKRVLLRRRAQKEIIATFLANHTRRVSISDLALELAAKGLPTSEKTIRKILREID